MKDITFTHSDLYPSAVYDPINGAIYRLDLHGRITRKLPVQGTEPIEFYDSILKKKFKKKAEILAWEIFNNKPLPDGFCVYFKDLDTSNLKINNLGVLEKKEFLKLKDALTNLERGIYMDIHPKFPDMYVVHYRAKGRQKRVICHDVVKANKVKRQLILKYTKILNKYLVSS